jgi:hypothetical protein
VAVLVVDGIVVVVVVDDDDDAELAGPVVLVDGKVVVEVLLGVVVVEEEPVDLEVPPDEEPASPESTAESLEVVALEAMPRVRGADLVWKASTPASPAAVATATIGARRLMEYVALSTSTRDRPISQREHFVVDPVARNSEPFSGYHDGVAEPSGSADVDVSLRQVRNELSKRACVQAHLVARADYLVKLAATLLDERDDLVAMN